MRKEIDEKDDTVWQSIKKLILTGDLIATDEEYREAKWGLIVTVITTIIVNLLLGWYLTK